jgi:23S rRNA pseudouridine1911/1915/1917 synthase
MVAAKDANAHRMLVEAFKAREVEKEYIALVHGVLPQSQGRIVASIGRHHIHRQKMAVQEQTGRYAASNWQVLDEYGSRVSKVRVTIETGRTHQIRVHMAHLGHPVAGDVLYGAGRNNTMFPRQMLHSWKISFLHPITGEKLTFSAPVWEDMSLVCERLARNVFYSHGN